MDFKTTYDFHGDGLSKIVRELMLFRKLPRAFIPDLMVRIEPGGGYVYVAEQTGGKVWPEGSSVFFFLYNLSLNACVNNCSSYHSFPNEDLSYRCSNVRFYLHYQN